jgi:hypothetical protein
MHSQKDIVIVTLKARLPHAILHWENRVLHRCLTIIIGMFAATIPIRGAGQAVAPAQIFVVCASQANQPTIYFSGVLQGPKTSLPGLQAAFTQFLTQHYAYKGFVGCLPTNNSANAQTFINNQSTALRNAKKAVVDTGWVESAAAPAPTANSMVPPATASVAAAKAAPVANVKAMSTAPSASPGTTSAASGAGGGAVSQLANVLGGIFGAGAGTSAAASGADAGTGAGAGANVASGSGSNTGTPATQVSSTLTNVFGSKAASSAPSADGGLGSAQAQSTKLVVYGCGRQDTQVACVTDLGNQNQKDTLVHADQVWKDVFIVDDRGDRHSRTAGFFLNVDGEQRSQLDISYGKTARFVIMFDGVPVKVQKVTLRCAAGGLDVEEITLVAAATGAQVSQPH